MKIEQQLAADAAAALKALYGADVEAGSIQLEKTKREFEGHLTLVVFPYLRLSRKKPEETAEEIGRYLMEHSAAVAGYNVIKGFLNLTLDSSFWGERFAKIAAAPMESGRSLTKEQLAEIWNGRAELYDSPEEGFRSLIGEKGPEDMVYAAGSLYLAGQLLAGRKDD